MLIYFRISLGYIVDFAPRNKRKFRHISHNSPFAWIEGIFPALKKVIVAGTVFKVNVVFDFFNFVIKICMTEVLF